MYICMFSRFIGCSQMSALNEQPILYSNRPSCTYSCLNWSSGGSFYIHTLDTQHIHHIQCKMILLLMIRNAYLISSIFEWQFFQQIIHTISVLHYVCRQENVRATIHCDGAKTWWQQENFALHIRPQAIAITSWEQSIKLGWNVHAVSEPLIYVYWHHEYSTSSICSTKWVVHTSGAPGNLMWNWIQNTMLIPTPLHKCIHPCSHSSWLQTSSGLIKSSFFVTVFHLNSTKWLK